MGGLGQLGRAGQVVPLIGALSFAHASTLGTARPAGVFTSWPRRADVTRVRATVAAQQQPSRTQGACGFNTERKRHRSQANAS